MNELPTEKTPKTLLAISLGWKTAVEKDCVPQSLHRSLLSIAVNDFKKCDATFCLKSLMIFVLYVLQ